MRKGFTLIELVVVIAVIAILSAVAVVSYVSITNRAKQSNDQQKVDQVNLSLAASEITGKPKTMASALEAIEEDGMSVDKFKAEAKSYEFGYAMEENRVVIIEKGSVVYPKDYKQGASANIWRFAANNGAVKADGFSYYLLDDCTGSIDTEAAGGLDVGKNKDITALKIKSTQEKLVVNSGGDQCVVTIDAGSADVDFYGFGKRVDVKDVKNSSLHIYGSIGELQLEKGHAQVETTGIVFDVVQVGTKEEGAGASVTNNGFIAQATLKEHKATPTSEVPAAVQEAVQTSMTGNETSKTLEVGSLAQLESFRDAVNSGNDFAGLTVKLTKDIALKDGWKPIGEGTRKVAATSTDAVGKQTFFAGTFDGQNKTISNLNNKDFVPTSARVFQQEGKTSHYAYGLFASVKQGAKIMNVKLSYVDIDQSRYSGAIMDSVAALVGYAYGGCEVENVSVSGTIKGGDSVCGIVGRVTLKDGAFSIKSCTNSANITASSDNKWASGICRVYDPLVKDDVKPVVYVNGNTNSGTITGAKKANVALINTQSKMNFTSEKPDAGATDSFAGIGVIA